MQFERKTEGTGILTSFPFANFFLRVHLGPTNPQQISPGHRNVNVCLYPVKLYWGTLVSQAVGILTRLDCYSQQDLLCCKVHTISR